ncbi:hypothetical protein [Mesorhizobium silamurunense]|uniref:hypothetical protein n=1 Tax=Mesorhizobium silamurunense TaxID=499528 RepID=UPI001FEFE8E9|nr:hypothetical protein [Mesorhizobium silamurunense]
MLDPKIFAEFCDAYTQETNRLRMQSRASIEAAQAEIKRIDREVQKLMDLYLKDALSVEEVKERGDVLRARKAELTDFLRAADEPPPVLHPAMASQYRLRVHQLHERLQDDSEEQRIEAANVLRTLIEDIILTPEDGKIEIDVRGDDLITSGHIAWINATGPEGCSGSRGSRLTRRRCRVPIQVLAIDPIATVPAASLAAMPGGVSRNRISLHSPRTREKSSRRDASLLLEGRRFRE